MYQESKMAVTRIKEAYQPTARETVGEPRQASPIDMELGGLRGEIDRMERLMSVLTDRLQPITCPVPTGDCKVSPPYAGCAIGSQINDATARVNALCNALDACMSSLQV